MVDNLAHVDYSPPAPDQVEVSLFGPGVGESVLVHLGAGHWMVVDSCIGRGRKKPAALEYLEQLGVDASEAIVMIVATHWHDDHVRGISQLLEVATSATFYAAEAIRPQEFIALTGIAPTSKFTSGVDELAKVARIADQRSSRSASPLTPVRSSMRLRLSPGSAVSEVWARSPSNEDLRLGRQAIAALISDPSPRARRVPELEPNDTSVVLHLTTLAGPVLLGGDLEHFPSSRVRGWHAVLDDHTSPGAPAGLFKVPHHGSINADCPEVWQHALSGKPVAILTPFERGVTPIPRPEDRGRIRGLASQAYLTSDKRGRAVVRDRAVEKTIRETTRNFVPNTLEMGQIQARALGGVWKIRGSAESCAV